MKVFLESCCGCRKTRWSPFWLSDNDSYWVTIIFNSHRLWGRSVYLCWCSHQLWASTPLGGIFLIARCLASPYPRLPALCRQDTTYTWRLVDAVTPSAFLIFWFVFKYFFEPVFFFSMSLSLKTTRQSSMRRLQPIKKELSGKLQIYI